MASNPGMLGNGGFRLHLLDGDYYGQFKYSSYNYLALDRHADKLTGEQDEWSWALARYNIRLEGNTAQNFGTAAAQEPRVEPSSVVSR
jgi:hypothetical protein